MKSMKKLVLAGLVLLASVVVLAGCKNDSVPEVPKYTVTFDKNAEDATGEMTPQTFTQGEKKELTANAFKRSTWTFSGWSEKKDATTPEYKDAAEFTTSKDTTLYAVWRDNGTVSDVTFDSPNGTKFYYGETVTLATTMEGATIKYRLDDSEDWKTYNEAISITSDTNITAYATKAGLKDSAETTASYTVRTLKGITVTPPTRTVYSEGESFDSAGMVVTATYDDGEERTVEGTITSETSSLTQTAGIDKKVTVSYTEGKITKQDSFTVVVFPAGVKILSAEEYTSPNHTDNTWTYVKFGEWPQSEVKDFSPKTEATSYGIFKENYYEEDDGKYVKVDDKYYLVEPIIWRVLNSKDGKYNESENPLLLAENILTGGIKWADSTNNYMESNIRKWLNGNSGSGEQSDYDGAAGFLQTAFTTEAQKLITPTTVDNSATSTLPNTLTEEQKTTDWNSGKNRYACANTKDKIFLLSEQEATKEAYGFAEYDKWGKGNTRIRVTTDYAKATGVSQSGITGYGGWWWLRSPFYSYEGAARRIYDDGNTDYIYGVSSILVGIVPALSISMSGN